MRIKFLIRQRLSRGISSHFVELSRTQCLIGRGSADIGLTEAKCSRQHALVFLDSEGQLRLKDLESTNGTLLNGRRLRKEVGLTVGDEIRIGDCMLTLVELQTTEEVIDGQWHEWPTRSPRQGWEQDEESWRKAA